MKLNLLSTQIANENLINRATVTSTLVILLSVVVGATMVFISSSSLEKAKQEALDLEPQVAYAYSLSKQADNIIREATGIERNLMLFQAIQEHNTAYTQLYKELFDYIPAFFRLTEVSAKPYQQTGVLVKLVGVIKTYQQYADLMLSLLRFPNVTKVFRKGFESKEKYVPGLVKEDQMGQPIVPGEKRTAEESYVSPESKFVPLPSSNAAVKPSLKYPANSNQSETIVAPLATESEVIVYVLVQDRRFQVPNPQLTLTGAKPERKKR